MPVSLGPALQYVLRNEGGFVDDPDDHGGATNQGITLATLSAYWGRAATVAELRDLSPMRVSAVYCELYWRPSGACWLTRQAIATAILDVAVLHGVPRAIRLMQQVAGVPVDGHPGPATLAAVDAMDPQRFLAGLVTLLGQRFAALVAASPRDAKFLPGWLARTHRLLGLYDDSATQTV